MHCDTRQVGRVRKLPRRNHSGGVSRFRVDHLGKRKRIKFKGRKYRLREDVGTADVPVSLGKWARRQEQTRAGRL